MRCANGAELLIHVGLNTVELNGKHFTVHVQEGESVKQGQLLLEFDGDAIQAAGYPLTTPVLVTNSDEMDVRCLLHHGDHAATEKALLEVNAQA